MATQTKPPRPRNEPLQETEVPAKTKRTKKEENSLRKFRLNHGDHVEQGWVEASQENVESDLPGIVKRANGKHYRLISRTYTKGDLIETTKDLVGMFNSRGPMGPKFSELLEDKSARAYQDQWDNLETLSEPKLRALAELEEIDLAGAKTREEILERLRQVINS